MDIFFMACAITIGIVFIILIFYSKRGKSKIENEAKNETILILSNIFNVSEHDIEQFNINNITQLITIIQIIIKSIGDTTEVLQIKSNIKFEEIINMCMEFSKKRCQDLNIPLDNNKQELILKLITSYLTSHKIEEN